MRKNKVDKFGAIHRLVAQAFIPNPNDLPQVNHKDENKANNCIDNLEWCTAKYNSNYGNRTKKVSKALSKKIEQYDINGNFIKEWDSMIEATKNVGVKSNCHIWQCCNKQRKSAYGYVWRYVDDINS